MNVKEARTRHSRSPEQGSDPFVAIIDDGYGDNAVERSILEPLGYRVETRPCGGDIGLVHAAVPGASAVLVRESPVDAAAMDLMPDCRVIVRYGVGIDNIDCATAASRHIYVANVPDYGFEEVSDHAMALMLAVLRRVPSRDRATRAGAWNLSRSEPMFRIKGKTLGLLGYGLIGQAFRRKAEALGFSRILVSDPNQLEAPAGTELVDLETLFRDADVVSLHAPLTNSTRHIVNQHRLALMKPGAVLINTARGGLIDEAALIEAIREKRIFGAGLDVFETEPPNTSSPLFSLPNVVLTDHTGWYSEDAIGDLQRKAAQEVARVLTDEQPINWVNRWNS